MTSSDPTMDPQSVPADHPFEAPAAASVADPVEHSGDPATTPSGDTLAELEHEFAGPTPETIEKINTSIHYAMFSVFRVSSPVPRDEATRAEYAAEVREVLDTLVRDEGLIVRGVYDVAGLRHDADLMFWWHAPTIEALQSAYRRVRRTRLGAHLEPVWSVAALHRPAEFNRNHVPAFLADEKPRGYICVYPFVRSYDWYVIAEEERREMLREHGWMARDYGDVRANTAASFALNDYEWILAFEADELHRIVDLMRELRASKARLHVREEVPFYTGPRVTLDTLVAELP